MLLNEWLSRLTLQKRCCQGADPKSWKPKLIQRLKNVNNRISCGVDYWVDNLLEGYIIEFVIDTIKSHKAVEKVLRPLNLWIKILLCEKGVLRMNFDE